MKFTFKTIKPTGRWRAFDNTYHYVKLKNKTVGTINNDKPHKIRLQVIKSDINEDGIPNCIWKWVTLKKESDSVEEAKLFLNRFIETILEKYSLYLEQDN